MKKSLTAGIKHCIITIVVKATDSYESTKCAFSSAG